MIRTRITPPALLPEALAELKDWLAISTAREDTALTALLHTALDACEGFARAAALEAVFEEVLPATCIWQSLHTAPVAAITAVEAVAANGTRSAIDPGAYLMDITADGCGRIKLLRGIPQTRIAVRFTAGLAPDWASLPATLRHGIIRLAAYHYRERSDGGAAQPPAAVVALWQPWRRMRIA